MGPPDATHATLPMPPMGPPRCPQQNPCEDLGLGSLVLLKFKKLKIIRLATSPALRLGAPQQSKWHSRRGMRHFQILEDFYQYLSKDLVKFGREEAI